MALKIIRDVDDSSNKESYGNSYSSGQKNSSVDVDVVNANTRAAKDQELIVGLADGQKQLNTMMERLVQQQTETNTRIQKLTEAIENRKTSASSDSRNRKSDGYTRNTVRCSFCGKSGHGIDTCFKRMASERAQGNTVTDATPPSHGKVSDSNNVNVSGNATPPS